MTHLDGLVAHPNQHCWASAETEEQVLYRWHA